MPEEPLMLELSQKVIRLIPFCDTVRGLSMDPHSAKSELLESVTPPQVRVPDPRDEPKFSPQIVIAAPRVEEPSQPDLGPLRALTYRITGPPVTGGGTGAVSVVKFITEPLSVPALFDATTR
jgi:hypothetical protein